jgi:hypothetical protein
MRAVLPLFAVDEDDGDDHSSSSIDVSALPEHIS